MHKVTLIPGDGIGPEITEVARRCVEATGVKIQWDIVEAGDSAMEKYGTPLPDHVIESIKKNKVAWKGPITTPIGGGFRSVNVALRKKLGLYMCLRPYKYYPGVRSKFPGVDLVVIRENTEDLYAGIEFEQGKSVTKKLIDFVYQTTGNVIKEDSGISIKPISISASRRIVEAAFKYAIENKRKKVTAVHKANIMKFSDGLFLKVAREVAKSYQGKVEFEDRVVDNMCMQLIQKPQNYDVLVLPNLYGDIISDLCAGLVGGLGVAPGANIGDDYAVFEPTHGSAPKYRGMNKVNPTGMILSGVMMLRWLSEFEAADKLENAISSVIKEGKKVTYDFKPTPDDPTAVGTKEMGEAIIERLLKK
ncbi:isocitrate/isopropylmalate dehydrogenase family protein [Candidatus Aerophobetes bacterium]|mgnify:CR=1 FL=1|nr:isocitrate/isopropylmalate dehydrogenase family protein [Candidatus Aerophobetes bacterium]